MSIKSFITKAKKALLDEAFTLTPREQLILQNGGDRVLSKKKYAKSPQPFKQGNK